MHASPKIGGLTAGLPCSSSLPINSIEALEANMLTYAYSLWFLMSSIWFSKQSCDHSGKNTLCMPTGVLLPWIPA